MKLSKKQEEELLQAYGIYFDSYMKGDIETVASVLDDEYTQVGSAEGEVFFSKKDAVQFLYSTIDQIAGKVEMRNRMVKTEQQQDVFLVQEFADLYALADGEWIFYSKFRATTFMQKKNGIWKIIHQHSSFPDTRTDEGQNISVDKVAEENLQLREAVKRRTIELEHKNRDLEIEASLERVRAVAMGMTQPADMLDICRVISDQFQALSIKVIRNVQTAVINESKGTYQNFEYYKLHDKTIITEVDYHHHKMTTAFVAQMLSGPEELFSQSLFGKELKDWVEHQKTTNQFIDVHLETTSSLSYYWYSIGPVALGVSTYAPLNESEVSLIKRFRNVFELAYRRFMDIERAEAQAKEAKIELALERVRARTMAMQQSGELADTAAVLFQQVKEFGVNMWICGFCIWTKDDFVETWVSADSGELLPLMRLPYLHLQETGQNNESFSIEEIGGEELVEHYRYMRTLPGADGVFDSIINAGHPVPIFQVTHRAYFSQGFLLFITYEAVPKAHELFKRFANVFDQTYTRFLDLQNAEAQAKESQIQLAMERVRAGTMAMQHSNELANTASILFQQIKDLGFEMWSCGFCIWSKNDFVEAWLSADSGGLLPAMMIPYKKEPTHRKIYEASLQGDTLHEAVWEGDALKEHYEFLQTIPSVKEAIDLLNKSGLSLPSRQCYYAGFFKQGYLLLITKEPTANAGDLTKRFARVFEQTYTRFLDLQKAEEQAKEAQIELGLERVRARAMAMQKSEELKELIATVFIELTKLDLVLQRCLIMIYDPESEASTWWMANSEAPTEPIGLYVKYHENPPYQAYLNAWKRRDLKWHYTLEGEDKKAWDNFLFVETELSLLPDFVINGMKEPTAVYLNASFNSFGNLTLATLEPLSHEQFDLLLRFAKVFDLTYTRFNDLQKAEAQAREAEIELALERVRARTMAMQHSAELAETSFLMAQQVRALGIKAWGCAFTIFDEGENSATEWFSSEEGYLPTYKIPRENIFLQYYEAAQRGETFHVNEILGKACTEHYEYLCTIPVLGDALRKLKDNGIAFPSSQIDHVAYFKHGYLLFITYEPVPEAYEIFKRFAKVFEQTYTRFLDLQKSETQVREAQIEAALERVRSRTMGMQKSEELKDIIQVVYEQFNQLNIPIEHTGFIMDYKARNDMHIWLADRNGVPSQITIPYFDSPHWNSFNESKEKGENFFANRLDFEEKNKFYKELFTLIPGIPDETKEYYSSCPGLAISTVLLENVGLYIENFSGIPYSDDENNTLMRFGNVFQQTYTRFLDLQKAEAQARESQIEAALERVRSRTLAMHKSDELAETSAVLFQQLIHLGIEPNRLYINIIKDDLGNAEFWITDEDGSKVSAAFETNMNANSTFEKMYKGWKEKKKSLVINMEGSQLQEYFSYLSSIHVPFKGGLSQHRRVQHIGYFNNGFIGMASPDEQEDETIQLLERFAAVFNLTYTRFHDLKIAEAHAVQAEEDLIKLQTEKKRAEDALTELRATQTQLIQSEKMASLGELTAGIAHEIQNPLNFVNNFSEVSNELIDEMMEEVAKGNFEEVKAIADDVKQNLEKINHHGKRADGIVKGMLQHSRTSSGTKELTDINQLTDEYLRLAYHGLRAKDKTFNATLKTEYGETVGNILVIPQDIGRVILNLITNAFYVVAEKKKTLPEGYEPTVLVDTKRKNANVEIKVMDNGNGIPVKILDKIFQPFFTTKPTGQGTGLGLSLAYDIVKAHGGELKVLTKEGEGSEFVIQLPTS